MVIIPGLVLAQPQTNRPLGSYIYNLFDKGIPKKYGLTLQCCA